jgi:hypothetical protein
MQSLVKNRPKAVRGESGYTWTIPGMPRRGWVCVQVTDHGEAIQSCEACGHPAVRFLHTIRHPAFRELEVGCICAGHLTGDSEGSRQREVALRRQTAWADRKWRVSRNGNPWLKARGHRIVVFPSRSSAGYCFAIDGQDVFGPFATGRAAKMASLAIVDALELRRKEALEQYRGNRAAREQEDAAFREWVKSLPVSP